MMVVGSVRYIPMKKVGKGDGASNRGREGAWHGDGGGGKEGGGGWSKGPDNMGK